MSTESGGDEVIVYNTKDFPYEKFCGRTILEKGKRKYVDVVATFDIETTTISKEVCNIFDKDFGFMYVWQFCIDGIVVMGRTWQEYKEFLDRLLYEMGCIDAYLVCYVHNLQFEFQFLRNFFQISNIFAREKRNVVYAQMEGVEYRCSYALTNMGLAKFLEKTKGVIHKKGKDFDYRQLRFPDTELTNEEYGYCVCDVLGLWEAIMTQLEDDDLFTIPITSTGYVRRDFREVCREDSHHMKMFRKSALNERTYILSREASRGAISGSSHIHTDEILEDVDSFDIKSSYPFQMATNYFPQSKFVKMSARYGTDKFDKLLATQCCIITWSCRNIRLKKWTGIPYISKAKCRAIANAKCGNGKVYMAERIGMTCTEIDFEIINNLYDYDKDTVVIHEIWCAGRDLLSKSFRKLLMEMFQHKTNLEDGDPYLYMKYKNKINASFGMMLTDILNPEIVFDPTNDVPWNSNEVTNYGKELFKYYRNRNSFLSYQHGVWVLAHARSALNDGMQIVGADLVQVDTDSVKTLGDYKHEFEKLNQSIIDKAESYDVKPYSYKDGKKHYLGVWEYEGRYNYFKTLGAKKYAVDKGKGIECTVSGLSKGAGKWFDMNGGLDMFKNGTIVPSSVSGRTASVYNDLPKPVKINVLGHEIVLGSNIAIKNVDYTLGMTSEWLDMVLDGHIDPQEVVICDGAWYQK